MIAFALNLNFRFQHKTISPLSPIYHFSSSAEKSRHQMCENLFFPCTCPIDEIISLRFLLTTLIVHSLCDRRILFCYFIPKWKCKIQIKYVYQHATASQTKGAEINKVVCAYSGSILLYISLIMSNLVAKDMEIKMICYILLFVWYIIYSHLYL